MRRQASTYLSKVSTLYHETREKKLDSKDPFLKQVVQQLSASRTHCTAVSTVRNRLSQSSESVQGTINDNLYSEPENFVDLLKVR